MMLRTAIARSCVGVSLLIASSCGGPAVAPVADVSPATTAPQPASTRAAPPATAQTTTTMSEVMGMVDSLTGGQLARWGSIAERTTAIEWADHFRDLDDLVDQSSVIFIGHVSGSPEPRMFDDPETDDSFTYSLVPVTVDTPLGGRRALDPGTTILMMNHGVPDELVGSRVVWFLVNARDARLRPDTIGDGVDAYPDEDHVYRFSPMAVWLDRGDGVPVAPVSEAERMVGHELEDLERSSSTNATSPTARSTSPTSRRDR
jgi:hypothetical protein